MNKYLKTLKTCLKLLLITVLGAVTLCVLFYFLYFLRSPHRTIPKSEELFVSPANGRVIKIIENPTADTPLYKHNHKVLDNFIEGIGSGATLVVIMMTPFDVHYQRAPSNATLIKQTYTPGKKKNATKNAGSLEATLQNEYNAMLFEREDGIRFRVIQIAGFLARRVVSYIKPDDKVQQGEIIGLIRFGSQVSIIFDKNIEVLVKEGEKVIDGETILAKLKSE
ncbi:MAG: phosphatidylserine decarboxylase [Candidatus Peribacteria bacterium]|jgi:phosphatidylserine decarboxylase|nr:phosphatidylserine decarboxylase [Candidatus Peribacteria bacterium]